MELTTTMKELKEEMIMMLNKLNGEQEHDLDYMTIMNTILRYMDYGYGETEEVEEQMLEAAMLGVLMDLKKADKEDDIIGFDLAKGLRALPFLLHTMGVTTVERLTRFNTRLELKFKRPSFSIRHGHKLKRLKNDADNMVLERLLGEQEPALAYVSSVWFKTIHEVDEFIKNENIEEYILHTDIHKEKCFQDKFTIKYNSNKEE